MDKIKAIKKFIGDRMDETMDENGNFDCAAKEAQYLTLCSIDTFIDSLPEEPASEELGKEIEQYEENFRHKSTQMGYKETARHFAQWQKQKDEEKKLLNNLWKDAEGEDLPEIDREVIVLIQDFPQYPDSFKVGFGHRPNQDSFDGKSLTTGEVEHYIPKTYDKGGWNIPNVKYWLDCSMPKEIEL